MHSSPDTPRRSPCLLGRQQSLHARCRLVQIAGAYMHTYGMPTTSSIFSNMSSNSESRKFNQMRG